jgi:hypothetical protein
MGSVPCTHSSCLTANSAPCSLADVSAKLKDLCVRTRSTLYNVQLALFMAAMHRFTRQDDILIGQTFGYRPGESGPLMGYFLNILVRAAGSLALCSSCHLLDVINVLVFGG